MYLDVHQNGLVCELRGGDIVLEVFRARDGWGCNETRTQLPLGVGGRMWGGREAGRNLFSVSA